jgi:ParB-like chromosome segregation protein Spo0J
MINFQRIRIEKLKPTPYNPRIPLKPGSPGYERLERSLSEFDLVEPIVWNEQTGHVVSGHQRLEILKDQGAEDVDVSVVSLSLEREKALNITLNNSQVGSDWDPDKLLNVVSELIELPDFDATLTGFNEDDLRDLLLVPQPNSIDEQASPDNEESQTVRVIFEIPHEEWESVRPEIDHLLAEWNLKAHIKTSG